MRMKVSSPSYMLSKFQCGFQFPSTDLYLPFLCGKYGCQEAVVQMNILVASDTIKASLDPKIGTTSVTAH